MNRSERRRQKKQAGKAAGNRAPAIAPSQASASALALAVQHHNAGRLNEAQQIYQTVLQSDPNNPIALNLLGVIAHQSGDAQTAIPLIQKALAVRPDYAEAHLNLGIVLRSMDAPKRAEECFLNALKYNPNMAEAHNNIGITRRTQGDLEAAARRFKAAIGINPHNADYHNNLGNALRDEGLLEEAEACFRHAIQLNPNLAMAHRHLARLKTYDKRTDDTQAMEDAYARSTPNSQGRMHLAFALSKVCEDLGEFDAAFSYLEEANAIHRKTFTYTVESDTGTLAHIETVFNAPLLKRLGGRGFASDKPIFILGLPRSGTSLVEQILASHPDVHGAGELDTFPKLVAETFGDGCNLDYPPSTDALENTDYAQLGRAYIDALQAQHPNTPRITDKLPINYLYLGLIHLALPNAKVIYCRRSLADTGLSLFKNFFSIDGHRYAYDLDELGCYLKAFNQLMDHWQTVMSDDFFVVNYEDLIANTEPTVRAMLDFCDLDWDSACLEFHKTERAVQTASGEQVRRPIYTSSVQAWKHYERQLEPMLKHLR